MIRVMCNGLMATGFKVVNDDGDNNTIDINAVGKLFIWNLCGFEFPLILFCFYQNIFSYHRRDNLIVDSIALYAFYDFPLNFPIEFIRRIYRIHSQYSAKFAK